MGAVVRAARKDRGWTSQEKLAEAAGIYPAQVSLLETGHNVESKYYAIIATMLGFRGPLEMLRAHDPLTRQLLRLWHGQDEKTKKLALKKLQVWLLED